MTDLPSQFEPFSIDEVVRVLGLPPEEAQGFNDIDFLYVYRAGQDARVSTKTLRLYREAVHTLNRTLAQNAVAAKPGPKMAALKKQ